MVGGKKDVKARPVAKAYRDSGLVEGGVDASGCVRLRSSPLQVISLVALKKLEIWAFRVRTALITRYLFARTQSGVTGALTVFGNCAQRLIG